MKNDPAPTAPQAARRGLRPFELILLVLLTVSLTVHALTITQLLQVRTLLRDQISQLAEGVGNAKQQTLSYNLPINQTFPVELDVPVRESMDIPIQTEVRITETINLPLDTGIAGTIVVPIPIDVTVPVNTTVPFELDQTVHISTTVPIQFDVPITIELDTPPFGTYLDQVRQSLLTLLERF